MIEWGITLEQFESQPDELIGKIMEYRRAEAAGQEALNQKTKSK